MSTPRSFFIIAIAILLWNLMGAKIFADMPAWLWLVYAVAVLAGAIGALFLLRRRRIAAPLFALSLIAVVVQFGYVFVGTDIIAIKGVVVATAFSILIFVIAVVQWRYASAQEAKGLLR